MAGPFRRGSVFEAASDAGHRGGNRARTRRPWLVRRAVRLCANDGASTGDHATLRGTRALDNARPHAIDGNARGRQSTADANAEATGSSGLGDANAEATGSSGLGGANAEATGSSGLADANAAATNSSGLGGANAAATNSCGLASANAEATGFPRLAGASPRNAASGGPSRKPRHGKPAATGAGSRSRAQPGGTRG